MAATCSLCQREMNGQGCTMTHLRFGTDPKYYTRRRVEEVYDGCKDCHDCAARVGLLHHDNCDMERCPKCGGQLLSCDCDDSREYSRMSRRAPKAV